MFINICIVGVLACVVLDLWQRVLFVMFKIPPSNWAVVGRWLILFLRTMIWVQSEVAQRDAIKNELLISMIMLGLSSVCPTLYLKILIIVQNLFVIKFNINTNF